MKLTRLHKFVLCGASILGLAAVLVFGGYDTGRSVASAGPASSIQWSEHIGAGELFPACAGSCVPEQGSACSSPSNSCGQTNPGTVKCDGTCSAAAPSDINCLINLCVQAQGSSCTSSPNSCGQTSTGTISCDGSCSATTPSDASCPAPTPTPTPTPTPPPPGDTNCYPWGTTLPSGQSVTYYNASSVACGSTCSGGTFTCSNGSLLGYTPGMAAYQSCSVDACVPGTPPPASCSLPWGGSIASGSSVIAYQTPTVTPPTTCVSVAQSRVCSNGTLSGSYTNQSCTATAAQVTISASPTRVQVNGSSTVSWNATNVSSCVVSGPSLSASTKTGSQSVTIVAQSTYTITCQAGGTSVTKQVIVNVTPDFQEF